ncbi:PotD/PotF family extracellular solute-binding protein [Pseudogracilibacillus auburnensis]|uniref:Spermidine/putrescine-binding protein n=1 Tax=Pseudogracilibacillus auburnensis TaxID=1494959 RepID=A0A2V3W5C7_9BACI|nr:spermidine/putrescine ABC transporter substrate-binding protein [Pseudogracilibacillus auburnensis]MBO1002141.1 spermidine/putrescine ABC transporter substrate-binding protein [Pseudogracilibacillus auburnensis]PXW87465.1 spermidine/putrescine-binding protein [Pseudogracilibacillus auburnensis]
MESKIIRFIFISSLIFSLVACSGSDTTSNEKDKQLADELIIFNWSEYMPDEIIENFESEFAVDVTYTTFSSNQEMLAKVRSGTVPYDLAVPSDFYVQVMQEEGLLEEIDFTNIPNFENIADEWKNLDYDPDNKYSVTYMYGFDGLIYNKEKVKEPPTSWADLWNPDYKGHVILMDASDEISDMLQQYLGNEMNNPTIDQIEEGGEKLIELMPNVLMFTETPEAQLVSGEAWLVYGYSGEAGVAYLENDQIDFVLPKEGGIRWTDNMVIPTTSKNKYTAEVFMNYLLRPDVSKLLSEEFPYGNPNKEAVELLDEELFGKIPGFNLPADQIENAEWSEVLDPDRTQAVNRIIQEAKVKGGH